MCFKLKERQTTELQDRRGWGGCSHMLCPDKAHLLGLGLPLALSSLALPVPPPQVSVPAEVREYAFNCTPSTGRRHFELLA